MAAAAAKVPYVRLGKCGLKVSVPIVSCFFTFTVILALTEFRSIVGMHELRESRVGCESQSTFCASGRPCLILADHRRGYWTKSNLSQS
jgi:hypothetical protein